MAESLRSLAKNTRIFLRSEHPKRHCDVGRALSAPYLNIHPQLFNYTLCSASHVPGDVTKKIGGMKISIFIKSLCNKIGIFNCLLEEMSLLDIVRRISF